MSDGLFIPPSKRSRNGLTVYCNKCKKSVTDLCGKTGKPLKQCRFGKDHRFKAIYYLKGSERKERFTKILETRNLQDALIMAVLLQQEIQKAPGQKNNKTEIESISQEITLVNAFAKYIAYLKNEDVPIHLQKNRSEAHVKDVEYTFGEMLRALHLADLRIEEFLLKELNDVTVGMIYSHFTEKGISNRTHNKYFSYATSFLKWWDAEQFPIRNWFARVTRKEIISDPKSITKEEFSKLLEVTVPELGEVLYPGTVKPKRDYYRNYLPFAFKLGLLTRLRREELCILKRSNIKYDDSGNMTHISVEDFKASRISKRQTPLLKYVPITVELGKLLEEEFVQRDVKDDDFLIAPELRESRVGLRDILSRGFTHFFNQTDSKRKLTFKALRKTYVTSLKMQMGKVNSITNHSTEKVIDQHYIDREETAKRLKSFSVFEQASDKSNAKELDQKKKGEIER